jgi:DNA invertase Pin-like site-specific DNA recombinase
MSDKLGRCAAGYVRMSTDMQDLSLAVQESAITEYARDRGMTVVRTYRDEARSGRSLKHREAGWPLSGLAGW